MPRDLTLLPDVDDFADLAAITPEDVETAKQAWAADAPPLFKTLLDAEPEDDAL